jgi:hypothetical protein
MKRAGLVALLILSTGVLYASDAYAESALRVGGGMFLEGDLPGVGASVDIPLGSSGAALTPFADYFFKGDDRVGAFGANLTFKSPAGEKSWMYIGVGGGFGNVRSEKHETDYLPDLVVDRILEAEKTGPMGNIALGFEYASTERTSMFVQGKWIGMFSGADTRVVLSDGTDRAVQLDVKHVAVQLGLTVHFGSREKDFDY